MATSEKIVTSFLKHSFIYWLSHIAHYRVKLCSNSSQIQEFTLIQPSGLHKPSDGGPPQGGVPQVAAAGTALLAALILLILMASAAITGTTAPIDPSYFFISKEHLPGLFLLLSPCVRHPPPPPPPLPISLLSRPLGSGI